MMTEVKTGKQINANPPYCRCRCSFEGPWFPEELYVEITTFDEGGCGCGCEATSFSTVDFFAVY
jgi:hypothetical protein